MKTGTELIAEERARQVAIEGWTPEHDDEHDTGELARAAACYAIPPDGRRMRGRYEPSDGGIDGYKRCSVEDETWIVPTMWPSTWAARYWKPAPDDRVRELVKAGALIAAEIDRLQRAAVAAKAAAK